MAMMPVSAALRFYILSAAVAGCSSPSFAIQLSALSVTPCCPVAAQSSSPCKRTCHFRASSSISISTMILTFVQYLSFLLLLAHPAWAVTVYPMPGEKATSTMNLITTAATGYLAYNPQTLTAPAIPTAFPTQVSVQVSSGSAPPGSSIPHMSSFFGFSIEMSVANQVCE